jgi:hypothetical protein
MPFGVSRSARAGGSAEEEGEWQVTGRSGSVERTSNNRPLIRPDGLQGEFLAASPESVRTESRLAYGDRRCTRSRRRRDPV